MAAAQDEVLVRDSWAAHPQGRLHVRQWMAADRAASPADGPIVLLHDSLGCVELWRGFPAALARATGRRVVAYDRLGFGLSSPHPARLGPGFVAAEAAEGFAAVKAHLGFGRFIAFGHSVGGGMAVHCAAHYAGECAALVTESAQAFVEERTLQGIREAQQAFRQPGQLDRLTRYHGDKAAWVLSAWIDTWLDPAFADWSLAGILPRVGCPVLALHGREDEYGSPRHPQLIAELAGGEARACVLDGILHVPHREDEDRVLREVLGFLGAVSDQPAAGR